MNDKRLLFITGDEMTVYSWRGGCLSSGILFPAGEEGFAAFADLIAEEPLIPCTILVDMVEEEFRVENAPYVVKDRAQLMQRTAERLFRGAPWRRWQILGREKEGRRDSIVLFSAITNGEVLKPWLEILIRHKAPLSAIHSVPYLTEKLFKPLGLSGRSVLILTDVEGGGLRQTFFREGQLAISRLSPESEIDSPELYAAHVVDEVSKTRRYLQRLQMLPFGGDLEAWVISDEERLLAMERSGAADAGIHLHGCALDALVSRLGLEHGGSGYQANLLFAQLAAMAQGSGYARVSDRRYALHRMISYGLNLIGLAALGLSLAGAANLLFETVIRHGEMGGLVRQAEYYERLAAEQAGAGAVEEGEAARMRSAVDSARWLARVPAMPEPFLRRIGIILMRFPEIESEDIVWRAGIGAAAATFEKESRLFWAEAAPDEAAVSEGTDFRQAALIEGRVILPDGDLRKGLLRLEQLVQALRREMPDLVSAEILKQQSFDFGPEGTISGMTSDVRRSVPFAIRLVIRVDLLGGQQGAEGQRQGEGQ